MFWGLILNANKKYSQKVKTPFRLSQAALDINSCSNEPVQVVLRSDNKNFILCTLRKNSVEQVALDLSFAEDDVISFISQGNGNVHLSGYFIPDEFQDMMNDEDSESDEDEQLNHNQAANIKRKLQQDKKQSKEKIKNSRKKVKQENEEDDEDDDDDEEDVEEMPDLDFEDESDEDGEEEEADEDEDDDDEDDDDDDDEEEEDSEVEIREPKAKQIKLDKNVTENGKVDAPPQSKKDKKKQKQPDKKASNEKVLSNGVKIQDLTVGNGPEAKSGNKISVYYEGRLKSNNKMFDSSKIGPGFKFVLGRGEVIKGWDIGVVGMKVGGKRRVICPPHVAYGQKGSPPVIPPNSTLVFDVELKSVN